MATLGSRQQSIAEQDIDLRDPKLSIASDGRLMLVAGGSLYAGTEYGTRAPRIAFSDDGYTWTTPQKVLAEDHWLWRVTWHEGIAYSVSKLGEGSHPRRGFLYSSTDGLDWQWITEFFPAQRHMDGQRDHPALYAGRHHDRPSTPRLDWHQPSSVHRLAVDPDRLPNGRA